MPPTPTCLHIFADGFVSRGHITLWAIGDNHHYASNPELISDYTIPSALKPALLKRVEAKFFQLVARMCQHGFDYSFVEVEFIVDDSANACNVMEVNARMCPIFSEIFRRCLDDGDQYRAQIQVALGEEVKRPRYREGLVGSCFEVRIAGVKQVCLAEELVGFHLAKSDGEVDICLTVAEGEELLPGRSFLKLGYLHIVSESYERNCQLALATERRILKRPEMSPRFGSVGIV